MNKKKKKAELTTQQIVMIIILITSFAIILFLLFRLNLGEETTKELCRNSVLLRGRSALQESTPLNCYRSYECITANGNCEDLTKPQITKVKNLDEIYQKLAENMADCWWMFGEGNVNYVGKDLQKNNYCSICSQILFDDSLNDIKDLEGEGGEISKDKLYDYLKDTTIPGGDITYSQYLFGTNNLERIKEESLSKGGAGTFGTIEIGKQFFVVMGINSEVSVLEWSFVGGGVGAGIGALAAGTLVALTPVGWVGGAIVLVGLAATGAVGGGAGGSSVAEATKSEIGAILVSGKGVDNTFMAPTIQEVDSERFKALNCEEILTFT